MASEVRQFVAVLAAGSTPGAPQIVAMTMPPRIVRSIRVRTPPGPRGQVGWAIGMIGTPAIPIQAGSFIVADDEVHDFPIDGLPDSGAWQLIGYNTGTQPHSIYVTFHVDRPDRPATAAPDQAPLDVTP